MKRSALMLDYIHISDEQESEQITQLIYEMYQYMTTDGSDNVILITSTVQSTIDQTGDCATVMIVTMVSKDCDMIDKN